MTSPAERYSAARRRAAEVARSPELAGFAVGLGFDLDPFQRVACEALERGSGVLVCAPSGAGKTVVGEFAVHLALAQGRKCFYTTPIKALSNQKFHDLVRRYGAARVGLLTGDNSINGDAAVVVMTTEVLRNMLYAGSDTLSGLSYVVMDEVHYLADRFRGAVWEEVIIHLPASVTLVSLSATVSNAEEFADWLVTVRGHTEVVVSEHRPVPLWQHMLVGKRMFDLFHDAEAAQKHDVHPELLRYNRELARRIDGDARGINMPARCVVLERLVKFNGEQHVALTPGESTQLTGRAGRRGIDVEGHAVVVWSPEVDPRHVAGLASTRTYPLRSSFRPSYNMAVNLVGTVGGDQARELLESSFAQFQADRSVVGLARQVQRNIETMGAYESESECHLGDFAEYFDIRVAIADRERAQARNNVAARKAAAVASIERLKIGDVIRVPHGRRAGLAVILDPGSGGFGEPRPLVLTEDRWAGRLSAGEFAGPVEALARVRVPKHFNHRSPAERRDLAAALRAAGVDSRAGRRGARRGNGEDVEIARLRHQLRAHPCHACPEREEHARWAERRHRLEPDTQG